MATELTATTQFLAQNVIIDFGPANQSVEANVELGIEGSNTSINVDFISCSVDGKVTPKDIIVSNTSSGANITYTITGQYGDDITPDHQFKVRTGNDFQFYYSYPDLQAAKYDHIISFTPDSSHHKIVTYTFRKTSNVEIGSTHTITTSDEIYTHYVHMDPSAWVGRLQTIVAAEKAKHEAGLV